MNIPYSNPCTRCGKQRITSKSWEEEISNFAGKSIITHTESVCPDPDCQEIVAKQLAVVKEKNDILKLNRENRMKLNKRGKKD